jgi:Spy/CpxP family protein refolding chaperone
MNDNATLGISDTSGSSPAVAHPPRRRLAAFGWLTAGLLAGATATAGLSAYAHGAMKRGFGGGLHSVEQLQERVADRAAWIIGAIDATPEQETAIRAIVEGTLGKVYPMAQRHRENRREFVELLARPEIDAAGLETLRKAELGLLDSASAQMSRALVELSDVLTKEQRHSLMKMANKHRQHYH